MGGRTQMSRPLRMLEASALYLVTIRCLQGRLFLRPSGETYDVLGGVLARAVRFHGVELFVFSFASNHLHLIVRAPQRNLPQFMQYLLSNISKKIGALVRWRGAFWERRYAAQPLLDEAALLEKVRYVLAHGVKEGLVRRCSEWPGLSALPLMRDGTPRTFRWMNWTRRCRSAPASRRGPRIHERWAEPEELKLTTLPIRGFDRLSVVRRFLDDCVHAIEKQARLTYRKVMGAQGVCEQDPQRRPARPERSAAPWCHASTQRLREEFMERYRSFASAFLEASAAWRAGDLDARFPLAAVRPFLWPGQLASANAA
ncbi:MAG TPA: transposase [Myxococcaceae bacterium]|nr:transposase [Myxococcaceae bacterium]